MLRAIDRLYLSCQVKWAEQQKILHRVKRDGIPTDPKFREMWYLVSNIIGKIFYMQTFQERGSRKATSLPGHFAMTSCKNVETLP